MHDRHVTENPDVELRQEGGSNQLVGYAAVFNAWSSDLGGFREIIRPGAFTDSLAESPDVSARIQHQGGLMTIGRTTNGTLRLHEDSRGLRYEVTPPDTSAGRDILELVRGGYIDKSSFAFSLREGGDAWRYDTHPHERELLSVNLHDVAPVDGPAYEASTVAARMAARARFDVMHDRALRSRLDGLDR